MKNIKNKAKIIAILAISFVVFATTFFALAQSTSTNSLFLDSDQDGLTDQEERMIGTDPGKADTDGDGYSDGKEVASGYNPLKAAPGDKIVPGASSSSAPSDTQASTAAATSASDSTNSDFLSQLGQTDILSTDAAADLSSDPNNPNLTNEMIGQLMQRTLDKATTDGNFADNPTFSADDLAQVTQGALQTVDITKDLPEIQDSELNILPAIDDKKLSDDDLKAKQKTEIEKYLAQVAFIFASNSPFAVDKPENLQSQLNTESANLFSAFTAGDTSKIDSYATKAQAGIDQLKKIEVPYILKDIDKLMLQLALYTLNLKSQVSLNTADPMKSLAAASSLQAVAQKSMELQGQLSQILSDYGIDAVSFP